MEGQEEAGAAPRKSQGGAQLLGQPLLRHGTEAPEEVSIAAEQRAQHFGLGEDDVPVGDRQEDVVHQVGCGLEHLALMAGGAEPGTAPARGRGHLSGYCQVGTGRPSATPVDSGQHWSVAGDRCPVPAVS